MALDLLLTTKMNIPPLRSSRVERPHLIKRLQDGLAGKLTLITAPAGYGKTSLMTEWTAQTSHAVAWLSLDANDDHLPYFLRYLIAAIGKRLPEIGKSALAMLTAAEPRPAPLVLTALINEMNGMTERFVLLLDDYHCIQDTAIHEAMAFLLDYLPDQMHLMMTTRLEVPFSLARLRVRGQLNEVSLHDLRFNEAEAVQFFSRITDVPIPAEIHSGIFQQTEGWVAGLQLAGIGWRHTGYKTLNAFPNGTLEFVTEYVSDEIVRHLPDGLQAFLLKTSILDSLCAELCDAVVSENAGKDALASLQKQNLFLDAIDSEGKWYRYHPLFAQALQQILQKTQPDLIASLHQRASGWYAANGFIAKAIHHALLAKDYETALHLIEPELHYVWVRSELPTVLAWLDALPDALVRSRPQLCLTYAWGLTFAGNFERVDGYLASAEHLLEAELHQNGAPSREVQAMHYQARVLRIRLLARDGHYTEAIQGANHLLVRLDPSLRFLRAMILQDLGKYFQARGELHEANDAFAEAAVTFQPNDNPCETMMSLLYLAQVQIEQNQLAEAEKSYRRIVAIPWQGPVFSAIVNAHIGLSQLYYDQNRLRLADKHTEQALKLSQESGQARLMLESFVIAARLQQAQNRAEPAKLLWAEAEKIVEQSNQPELFEYWKQQRPDSNRRQGLPLEAMLVETLTEREIEVLRLAANGLSNREIAQALVVSVGTAKKHLSNIFSKLNAQSRTQAIARARELSLI